MNNARVSSKDTKGGVVSIAEVLREGVTLTRSEIGIFETHYSRVLTDDGLASRVGKYLLKIRQRIERIEDYGAGELHDGHLALALAGLDLDDDCFENLLHGAHSWIWAVNFPWVGRPLDISTYFAAIKMLLGVSEQKLLSDEISKELTRKAQEIGQKKLYDWQKEPRRRAVMAAQKRLQRARKWSQLLCPYLIRGFVNGVAKPAPSSSWVKVN